jgi:hypothetical protein
LRNQYGTTKGTITAGQNFPNTANFDTSYSRADAAVANEVIATGDGTSKVFYKTLAHGKISPSSVTVHVAGGNSATDDGRGTLVGTGVTGSINYGNGAITVVYSTAPANNTGIVQVDYGYMIEGTQAGISEINSEIDIVPVKAISRKLVSLLSVEASEDLKALFGVDAEAELVTAMTGQVALEIDRDMIAQALASVPVDNRTTWDTHYDSTAFQIPQVDHIRTLVTKISQMSQKIYKKTLRGVGNWIVTSPEVISQLDQLPEFTPSPVATEFTLGIQKVGMLNGKWTVYSDPYAAAGQLLIGYKGASFADAGGVYAPYIPIQLTPTFFNPGSQQMTKGIRTRYAFEIVNGNYFALITVLNP